MTDLERQAMETLAGERDTARERCRDALAARDRALACEQAALGLAKSIQAERDDLLGALRALVVAVQAMFDAIDDPDYKSWPGVREDQLRQAALRARAAIAKVGGKESK